MKTFSIEISVDHQNEHGRTIKEGSLILKKNLNEVYFLLVRYSDIASSNVFVV